MKVRAEVEKILGKKGFKVYGRESGVAINHNPPIDQILEIIAKVGEEVIGEDDNEKLGLPEAVGSAMVNNIRKAIMRAKLKEMLKDD